MKHAFYYSAVGISATIAVVMVVMGSGLGSVKSSPEHRVYAIETSHITDLTPSAVTPSAVSKSARLMFFGDMMLGRNVEALTNKYGEDYLFEKIDDFLQSQSYIVANLEGPIVSDHAKTPTGSFSFSFKDTSADFLARHGFDLVSLANNHTLNQGGDGFLETEALLDAANILHIGHPNEMTSERVVHTTVDNLPITFVGFNMTFEYDDPDAAVATIVDLASSSAEQIVVFMHWGDEYQLHSNAMQQELAHKLIDAGADLIIGAHPHVVQEVEEYNGKLIFYSLGNFIFDQYFSTDTQQGLAVGIDLAADASMTVSLYPLTSAFSQPSLMEDTAKQSFFQSLADRSDPDLFDQITSGQISTSL